MSRYEWREGYGLWDNEGGTYLLLGDDEHARILWAALQATPAATVAMNDVERDAARFRFLVEHCSGGYEATEEQPAECHLVFEWQQSKPSERYWTVVNAIDAAMLAAAEVEP